MEDFHSLDCIKAHFEVWRHEYADCYRDAYIGLCLPKLFNPLVRLQLISWNPLDVRHIYPLQCKVFLLEQEFSAEFEMCFFFTGFAGTMRKL